MPWAHSYTIDVDLSNVPQGKQMSFVANPVDVPNRFEVRSGTTVLVQSGWRGYTTQPGPWGPNLNIPGDFIATFTKGTATKYTVYVETVVGVNDVDSWHATISCK